MDIVYACLDRKRPGEPPGEAAEVLGALWAHATPDDGLEHASVRPDAECVGVLLYLLSREADPDGPGPLQRAGRLLARCHQASPLLHHRYLPPRMSAPPGPGRAAP